MKATLVAAGSPIEKNILLKYCKDSFVVCADYGIKNFIDLEILPELIIGDLDSSDDACKKFIEDKKIKLIKLNIRKDFTDSESAISYLIENKYDEITLLSVTGTRLDHTLSNIFLLEKYFDRANIKIVDNNNEISYVEEGEYIFRKDNYKYLSILSISDKILLSSQGLSYEVENFTINRAASIGVSNEIINEEAKIILHKGKALIIKSKDWLISVLFYIL